MPDKHTSNVPVAAAGLSSMSPAAVNIQSAPGEDRQPGLTAKSATGPSEDSGMICGLNELQRGAITEAFNRGVSLAAASLSDMTDSEITLSVQELHMLNKHDAAKHLNSDAESDITGVKELVCGAIDGSIMLLFPTRASLNLVRLLLKESVPPIEYLTEMEEEALLETGNIILNACLGVIAEALGTEILNEIPHAVCGRAEQLLIPDEHFGNDRVIQLKMDFGIDGMNIRSSLAMVLDITSLDHIRDRLTEHVGTAA